ncbi:MAG TPA: hypothetical protein DCE41_17920 [Cytophagales bacterium]|nr:hypothetical protein [Cytophagales bacterium]HAA23649.1 hypothetical protein [Cytophagales bacterium]HAP65372.1 hypothetical protein [Cytophagales bacterium]
MYTVTIKDHIMIAHSLPDPFFGPAQNMHGATFHVEVEFQRAELTEHAVVLDMGEAHTFLKEAISPLAYQNLDELPKFKGQLTTTEFLARHIHDEIRQKVDDSIRLKVTLEESHVAKASYQG